MTDEAVLEIRQLRQEVATLLNALSPFIEQAEMQARYGVCGKTLLAMERRGEIPYRQNGRWRRTEVMLWEGK